MNTQVQASNYSVAEEIANSITHGIGILLSSSGLALLVVFAHRYGDSWHVTASAIFGSTLVLSYTASTLYHGITAVGAKRVLKVIDHAAIYLLIAGTYTPFTLISLRGPWGWTLFATIWGLALIGIILKITMIGRFAKISTLVYVMMGWIALIAIKPLLSAVEPGGVLLLLSGGLAYSVGVIFYVWKKLPYNHAVWHLFVIAGSLLHFFAVLFYVIPST